ncbi:AmmeMemoRadiSam system protein B [Pseudonocardia sp.]|jgi:AmmeMemoRadiSam system protein B|uniref:AmmeMemoRadiSam system protein B n=1 Tax=Pseudonocardia sp. TaxID=60912 RepID=UPI0031FC5814
MAVRPAAVADRFYPADPGVLASRVDGLLADARPTGRRPAALIAPHAGYRYSGAVAGSAYAQLAACRADVTRVVVLGPAHYVPLTGSAVPNVDAFATPLGPVPIDPWARQTAAELPGVTVDDRPHAPEHAIETQLPFLIRTLGPDIPMLPVLVGATEPATVARLLAALLTGPETVAVVSTDLSHYLDQPTARERDTRTATAILARDTQAITSDAACGCQALRGLLRHAAECDMHVELLRLATSADAGADPARVVGYGAFMLTP